MSALPRPWIQDALRQAEDADLIAELHQRGYAIGEHLAASPEPDAKVGVSNAYRADDRNTEPEEKWLQVWGELGRALSTPDAERLRIDALALAVEHFYLLLEPPSVRKRRLNDG